jgi:hypothetical protein
MYGQRYFSLFFRKLFDTFSIKAFKTEKMESHSIYVKGMHSFAQNILISTFKKHIIGNYFILK